ncbi:Calx-beta domain-containing protein [Falsiroseomonas sp. HW251]|uniref:Calx-beta domain-containing protein n=1 Tax=Falsiroseomonas sp. HW251 TaxID=3390998 RepID=UPI003D31A86A
MAVLEKRVASGADDVEQRGHSMSLSSTDLELIQDGTTVQQVGLRFTGVDIPVGANITRAYIQFTADEVGSASTSLLIRGEDVNDAAAFTTATDNLSARSVTDASAAWSPPAWTTVGAAGLAQQTPDLSAVVQEIVGRSGWAASNDMAFIFTGSGTRTAEAFEGSAAGAPLLHVEWTAGGPSPPLTVTVADGTPSPQIESTSATIGFTISLSAQATGNVLLTYSTVNGTATAGSDFTGATGKTATIAAGQTGTTIAIGLTDDNTAESNETFRLKVDQATLDGASLTVTNPSGGTGTIKDDDTSPPPSGKPKVVAIHSTHDIGSTDPSGLAYVPGKGLFLSDSEVDETPFSRPFNLFLLQTDATPRDRFNLSSFTKEPTGLAYNPSDRLLYVSDDDKFKVFSVDPNTPDARRGEFLTKPLGGSDPEDLAVDPSTGNLFIVNGTPRTIVETNTTGTQVVSQISLPTVISDPEALVYDAQHDRFLVGGGFSANIWVVDRGGHILQTIDLLSAYRNEVSGTRTHVKDLEFAPSSDPNDDPNKMNLYVADYGNSHVDDGRLIEAADLFEIDLGADRLIA